MHALLAKEKYYLGKSMHSAGYEVKRAKKVDIEWSYRLNYYSPLLILSHNTSHQV